MAWAAYTAASPMARRNAGVRPGAGGFLDHLLVTALDGTVAFVEIEAVAVPVGEDLDLHVARLQHVFLHQHPRIAKGGARFALGRGEAFGQVGFALDDLHALAAAAGGGLEQHRIADARRGVAKAGQGLVLAVIPRHQGHSGVGHQRLGRGLAAHGADRCRGWPDEDQPGRGHRLGEGGVSERKP